MRCKWLLFVCVGLPACVWAAKKHCIIGAGVSGLAAAEVILETSPDDVVEIIEANDRAGGRLLNTAWLQTTKQTFTEFTWQQFGSGTPPVFPRGLDIGGQWMHGYHCNPISLWLLNQARRFPYTPPGTAETLPRLGGDAPAFDTTNPNNYFKYVGGDAAYAGDNIRVYSEYLNAWVAQADWDDSVTKFHAMLHQAHLDAVSKQTVAEKSFRFWLTSQPDYRGADAKTRSLFDTHMALTFNTEQTEGADRMSPLHNGQDEAQHDGGDAELGDAKGLASIAYYLLQKLNSRNTATTTRFHLHLKSPVTGFRPSSGNSAAGSSQTAILIGRSEHASSPAKPAQTTENADASLAWGAEALLQQTESGKYNPHYFYDFSEDTQNSTTVPAAGGGAASTEGGNNATTAGAGDTGDGFGVNPSTGMNDGPSAMQTQVYAMGPISQGLFDDTTTQVTSDETSGQEDIPTADTENAFVNAVYQVDAVERSAEQLTDLPPWPTVVPVDFCDEILITVPLGVLKANDIDFNPPLPPAKQRAIKQLGYGNLAKLFLIWNTKPDGWPMDLGHYSYAYVTKNGDVFFPAIINAAPAFNQAVMVLLAGGDQADEMEEEAPSILRQRGWEMARIMLTTGPSAPITTLPLPDVVYISKWRKNPLSRGAYSFVPPGAWTTDFNPFVELRRPYSNFHFAGEATHQQRYGFVDGAFLSGIAAAREMLGQGSNLCEESTPDGDGCTCLDAGTTPTNFCLPRVYTLIQKPARNAVCTSTPVGDPKRKQFQDTAPPASPFFRQVSADDAFGNPSTADGNDEDDGFEAVTPKSVQPLASSSPRHPHSKLRGQVHHMAPVAQ